MNCIERLQFPTTSCSARLLPPPCLHHLQVFNDTLYRTVDNLIFIVYSYESENVNGSGKSLSLSATMNLWIISNPMLNEFQILYSTSHQPLVDIKFPSILSHCLWKVKNVSASTSEVDWKASYTAVSWIMLMWIKWYTIFWVDGLETLEF